MKAKKRFSKIITFLFIILVLFIALFLIWWLSPTFHIPITVSLSDCSRLNIILTNVTWGTNGVWEVTVKREPTYGKQIKLNGIRIIWGDNGTKFFSYDSQGNLNDMESKTFTSISPKEESGVTAENVKKVVIYAITDDGKDGIFCPGGLTIVKS